jgi:hypothetical protein
LHGNERALIGQELAHHVHELGARVALDVVFHAAAHSDDLPGDRAHVVGANVTAIGPRMHGNAWRAGCNASAHRFEHAGLVAAARVSQRSYLVYVDAELNHAGTPAKRDYWHFTRAGLPSKIAQRPGWQSAALQASSSLAKQKPFTRNLQSASTGAAVAPSALAAFDSGASAVLEG